ncbi:hypothetical protein CEUSTIGMA_g1545.t1, partial [Chlamydomonas eustigma]
MKKLQIALNLAVLCACCVLTQCQNVEHEKQMQLHVISSVGYVAHAQPLRNKHHKDRSVLRDPRWTLPDKSRRGLLQGEETLPFAHLEAIARKKRVAEMRRNERVHQEMLQSAVSQDSAQSEIKAEKAATSKLEAAALNLEKASAVNTGETMDNVGFYSYDNMEDNYNYDPVVDAFFNDLHNAELPNPDLALSGQISGLKDEHTAASGLAPSGHNGDNATQSNEPSAISVTPSASTLQGKKEAAAPNLQSQEVEKQGSLPQESIIDQASVVNSGDTVDNYGFYGYSYNMEEDNYGLGPDATFDNLWNAELTNPDPALAAGLRDKHTAELGLAPSGHNGDSASQSNDPSANPGQGGNATQSNEPSSNPGQGGNTAQSNEPSSDPGQGGNATQSNEPSSNPGQGGNATKSNEPSSNPGGMPLSPMNP